MRLVRAVLQVAAVACLLVFLLPQHRSEFDGQRQASFYGMGIPGYPWWRLDTVSDPGQGGGFNFQVVASPSWLLLGAGLGLLWVRRRVSPPSVPDEPGAVDR